MSLLFINYHSNAQEYTDTVKVYYYCFNVSMKNTHPLFFYGISQKNIPIPIKGKDLTSYMDMIYTLLDCCYNEWDGIDYLPENIISQKEKSSAQLQYSNMIGDAPSFRYKLDDGTCISLEKYSMNACLYSNNNAIKTSSSITPTWYFKTHPMTWYIIYNISNVLPCNVKQTKCLQ